MTDARGLLRFSVPAKAKRVVSFLSEQRSSPLTLPIDTDGVRIHALVGQEVFTSYLPHPKGPVFMTMLEKTFGKGLTTRTWETVRKCAAA